MSPNTPHKTGSFGKLVPVAFLALLSACNNGGSGGGGVPLMAFEDETIPNGSPATANLVHLGAPIHGDLTTPGDVDTFAMALTGGKVLKLELFATRHDQAGWQAGPNVPQLALLDTNANENVKLLEHDYSGNSSDGWYWGYHDLDIPMFLVPESGTYFVQVAQDNPALAGSSYILRASYVPVPGLQRELEAAGTAGDNDTYETAQPIHPGSVHGYHVEGELDYYRFTVSVPSIVSFETTAYRNGAWHGTAYYDTEIGLFDTDGTTDLAWDDDSFFYDSAIDYRIDTPGTYYIVVDEYDTAEAPYFLRYSLTPVGTAAESEPNDDIGQADGIAYGQRRSGTLGYEERDWYRFSGRAGDMLRLQYFDDSNAQHAYGWIDIQIYEADGETKVANGGDGSLQTQTTILQKSGTFYIALDGGSESTAEYTLWLTLFKSAGYETEPNNDFETDHDVLQNRVAGVLDPNEDIDVYSVELRKDQLVRFVCYASSSPTDSDGSWEFSGYGSALYPVIELLDAGGEVVATSTSSPAGPVYAESITQPLPTCGLVFTAEAAGTYFLQVRDAEGNGSVEHYYMIEYERR